MTPALLDDLVRAAASEVLAVRGLDPAALPADPGVERPRNPAHGEYATSVALRTAGRVGVAPRELAGWLADALVRRPEVAGAEVAGPGFLNLRMTADGRSALVAEVLAADDDLEGATAVEAAADLLVRTAPAGLVHAVGADVARYSLVSRRPVDVRRTIDNPLFRVQYAHARAASLARNAAQLGIEVTTDLGPWPIPARASWCVRSATSRPRWRPVSRTGSRGNSRRSPAPSSTFTTPARCCRSATRTPRTCTARGWRWSSPCVGYSRTGSGCSA